MLIPEHIPPLVSKNSRQRWISIQYIPDDGRLPINNFLAAVEVTRLLNESWEKIIDKSVYKISNFFDSSRLEAYSRGLKYIVDQSNWLTASNFIRVLKHFSGTSSNLYKDSNVTNFINYNGGAFIIDFDTITLAPFGYDFAKLLLTDAVKSHSLEQQRVAGALMQYRWTPACGALSANLMLMFMDIHWIMAQPFRRKNSYQVDWAVLRPQMAKCLGLNRDTPSETAYRFLSSIP
ncbi:hypothetical protein DXT91_29470 [Agrobacterium tumefaciens]|nr:hypothetical protein [Agrobacterium tumefaciens]